MPKKQSNKAPSSKLSDDDTALFRNAVRDIKPFVHDKISNTPSSPSKKKENITRKKSINRSTVKKKTSTATKTMFDENQLFQDAVKDITPLQHDKVTQTSKPINKQSRYKNEAPYIVPDTLSDEAEVEKIQATDILSYCQLGIQKRVFKKLRRGQYITIDELDLHGLNLKQAKRLLLHFLEIARQVEGSCVSIIHGKGHRSRDREPVLKRQTNHWLQQHPRVLAFHSAQAKDGGTGAVYVLLRRTKTD